MEYTPYYITSFFLATQTYPPCVNVPSLMDEQMGKTDAMHNKIKYIYQNPKYIGYANHDCNRLPR